MDRAPRASRRRESSRTAILGAALELLREQGYAAVTVEGIAARAGAGKQTIYRWWPSKGAVVFEALLDALRVDLRFEDTGDLQADLTTQVAALARIFTSPDGRHLASLIGGAQSDEDLARAMVRNWLLPRREVAKEFLRRAQDRGQLRRDLDVEVAVDVIYAGLYYRLLLRYVPLSEDYAAAVVDAVLHGLATAPAAGGGLAAGGGPAEGKKRPAADRAHEAEPGETAVRHARRARR